MSMTPFLDTVIIRATVVPNSGELVRGRIGGQPLLDREELLAARNVGPSGGDLDVVHVPAVVGAGSVGGEVQGADGGLEAGTAAAKNVQIAPLEVVVTGAHQSAPGLEVPDLDPVAIRVVEPDVGVGVRPAL